MSNFNVFREKKGLVENDGINAFFNSTDYLKKKKKKVDFEWQLYTQIPA